MNLYFRDISGSTFSTEQTTFFRQSGYGLGKPTRIALWQASQLTEATIGYQVVTSVDEADLAPMLTTM